ncbi:MAG TPA: neutral zinc metallopeptidase [Acidimicrobiia bacterium]|jgi:predicted metalloprotease|nr:neutral zinc metallopeptidase [Acidimicrobiia bacterium]
MRWRRLETSSNVEDRRGTGGAVAAGAGGLGIVDLLIALLFGGGSGGGFGGVDDLLGQMQGGTAPAQPAQQAEEFEGIDESEDFVRRVLGSTETVWTDIFAAGGREYTPASLVLFDAPTSSACGGARSEVGPHYWPLDETIYVDLNFFDELNRRFGASAGDFAQTYAIPHEVADHVQNELDSMDEVQRLQRAKPGDANDLSVRLELQADCLAGVWASAIWLRENVLEPGDIDEALSAAAAVGDDRIQQATTGRVNPESWTHGSSEQRVDWFNEGYGSGDPNRCDTFSGCGGAQR